MRPFSEERIRAYFLGKFPTPEAEVFEEECAADEGLTEAAQTIERELVDDYLRGNLSPEDARCFEEHYLVTEARRRRLQASAELWRTAGDEPQSSAAAAGAERIPFWKKYFAGRSLLPLVAGGLFLLFVCVAIALYSADFRLNGSEVAEIKTDEPRTEPQNPVAPTAGPENQNQKTESLDPAAPANRELHQSNVAVPKTEAVPKPSSTPKNNVKNTGSLALFSLFPGTLRSEGEQFITVLPATREIRLQLKLPEDAGSYRIYRAVLRPVEGEAVYDSRNLKSLNLTIPAEKLENRTYIVFLEGRNATGEFESIAEYSFRVRR